MRLLAWLAGALGAGAALLLFLATDARPLVERDETISPRSIAQARWLFDANDPRRLRPGETRQVAIPVALIDDGINYLASRGLHGRGAFALGGETAEIRASLRLPLPIARFVNLRAAIPAGSGLPHLAALSIGSLPLPAALGDALLERAARTAGRDREWTLARQAIQQLAFEPQRQRVVLHYIWEPALLDHARAIALTPGEVAQLHAAHNELNRLLGERRGTAAVRLGDVLQPLLGQPADDARATRRAALLVLAAYLAEKGLSGIVPEAQGWPRLPPVNLTLAERHDSAQHFVVSAALAAWAGEPVADAIGLYKELADAHHGSGFSFADLAADRAGTRFGDAVARRDPRLDSALRQGLDNGMLIPALHDLPEGLDEASFRGRFRDTASPAYRRLTDEIESRIAALPLYRSPP
jgi:hypothetical protein